MLSPADFSGDGMMVILLALCSGFCRIFFIYLTLNCHLHLTLLSLVSHILKKKIFCMLVLGYLLIGLLSFDDMELTVIIYNTEVALIV